jgi:hypothetical protein
MLPSLILGATLAFGQTSPAPTPEAAPTPDRWALMKVLQGTWEGWLLDSERMQLTGWVDLSYTASSAAHNNLPLGFNYRANEFLLQQNWVRFERTVLTSGTTEPTFGFRCDAILPGADYRFTTARGLFSGQLTSRNGEPAPYGIDPIQFYAEGFFPTAGRGLDVKLGRFFAPIGMESNDAPGNALFSHAYDFIYNPFTNTGVLATLKLTDAWIVEAGLVLGSDVFIDPADQPTFLGSVKWTEPEERDTIDFTMILGSGRFNRARNFNNVNVFDLVWTHHFNHRLSYDLDLTAGYETDVPDLGTAYWLAMVHYLIYEFTPRVSGAARVELFDDARGQRTGFPGLYAAVTAGLSIRPARAVEIRPELRYDYNGRSRPFEGEHGLFTAAADLILRW